MENNQEQAPATEEQKQEAPDAGQADAQGSNEQTEGNNLILGKFKTQDDLIKSYEELEKKVPELSKQAKKAKSAEEVEKKYNQLVSRIAEESGTTVDEVLSQIEPSKEGDTKEDKVAQLEKELHQMKFESSHADDNFVKDNLKVIKAVANAEYDGDLEAALQDDAITALRTKYSQSDETSVIESNKRIATDSGELTELFKRAMKTGNREDWQKYQAAKSQQAQQRS